MKLPSKFFTYKESVISRFPVILSALQMQEYTLVELYGKTKAYFDDVNDYIDALTCLYGLNEIAYDDKTEKVKYVA